MDIFNTVGYIAAGAAFYLVAARCSKAAAARRSIKFVYSERACRARKISVGMVINALEKRRMRAGKAPSLPPRLDMVVAGLASSSGLDESAASALRADVASLAEGSGLMVRCGYVCSAIALEAAIAARFYDCSLASGSPGISSVPQEARRGAVRATAGAASLGMELRRHGQLSVFYPSLGMERAEWLLSLPNKESAALLFSRLCGRLVISEV